LPLSCRVDSGSSRPGRTESVDDRSGIRPGRLSQSDRRRRRFAYRPRVLGVMMKSLFVLAATVVTATALAFSGVADAKRLGSARSFGMQRQPAPQPAPSAPAPKGAASDPVMPAQPSAAAPRTATPTAPVAPAPSGM